jgi:hypothetical protein
LHRFARNALSVGLASGLVVGLVGRLRVGPVFGLDFELRLGLDIGLIGGLGFGLFVGLVVGLFYGGATVLLHYTLRWLLYRNSLLPLQLVAFLNYCAERIFLRRVGGGYIFVHRLLMEHFVSLRDKPNKARR